MVDIMVGQIQEMQDMVDLIRVQEVMVVQELLL